MALPKHRVTTHPGEMLLEEYLKPLGVTQKEFAAHIGVSPQRVNEIVRGKRGVSPMTAWLFAGALGTTPEYWLNLQKTYALWHAARDSLDWQKVHPIAQDVPDSPIGYPDLSEQRVSGLNALREDGTQSRAEETQRGTEKDRGRE